MTSSYQADYRVHSFPASMPGNGSVRWRRPVGTDANHRYPPCRLPEFCSASCSTLKTLIFWWCYLHLRLMRAAPADRRYEQRRPGDRLSDSQPCEHGIERRSDQPHSRFPIRSQGAREEPAASSAALRWRRTLSRTRSSPAKAALTSSGKPPCFPITLYLPEECKDISHRPLHGLSISGIAVLRSPERSSRGA